MSGWLDRLNPALRHSLLVASGILVTALLQYVQSTYTTWNLAPQLVALLGFLIPMAVNYFTSVTQQYGVGSPNIPNDPSALGNQ
jgi:hypothetical protein